MRFTHSLKNLAESIKHILHFCKKPFNSSNDEEQTLWNNYKKIKNNKSYYKLNLVTNRNYLITSSNWWPCYIWHYSKLFINQFLFSNTVYSYRMSSSLLLHNIYVVTDSTGKIHMCEFGQPWSPLNWSMPSNTFIQIRSSHFNM